MTRMVISGQKAGRLFRGRGKTDEQAADFGQKVPFGHSEGRKLRKFGGQIEDFSRQLLLLH